MASHTRGGVISMIFKARSAENFVKKAEISLFERACGLVFAALTFTVSSACDKLPMNDSLSSVFSNADKVEDPDPALLLSAAIDGAHRTDDERARDRWRHPQNTLMFFGIEPNMEVLEIWPGGGWYTNILAPYLADGGGRLHAAHFDPDQSLRAAEAVAAYKAEFTNNRSLYGNVQVTVFSPPELTVADATMDAVVTFRNAHNWIESGKGSAALDAFFRALKPGGTLGVVDHRADKDKIDGKVHNGYVTEASVISLAEQAGFQFEAKSDINANAADTRDHPFGVWTLPPVRRSASAPGMRTSDFPRAKYDAIGESDRMTLRFRKPGTIEQPQDENGGGN